MRHELKYMLTPPQYTLLKRRLKWVMKPDEHALETGEYFIRSIYFDSPDRMALREKMSGVNHRKKYRIRFYNGDNTHCMLECKEKTGTRISKSSEPLTAGQVQSLLRTHALRQEETYRQVSGHIDSRMGGRMDTRQDGNSLYDHLRMLMATRGFAPAVTVDYVREAYVLPLSDLRITFDKEIAWGCTEGCLDHPRFLSNIYGDEMVLEVKYNDYLPQHISAILSSVSPAQTAASKYVACTEAQYAALGY